MNDKLLIIIATQDKEKALTALAYAHNTIKYNWLSDVKVIFFGPFENLIASDVDIAKEAIAIAQMTGTTACKFCLTGTVSPKRYLSSELLWTTWAH